MTEFPLNTPEARQEVLQQRLARGESLQMTALAAEFDVSVDTIRRDIAALDAAGVARQVRGGAMPVLAPARPMAERAQQNSTLRDRIAAAALPLVRDGMVILLDGGSTVLRLAQMLPPLPRALVVTPSPAAALATLASGTPTLLIGGPLSPLGAIAVGPGAVAAVQDIAADLCFLGVCGLDADFGLGADDAQEAAVKQAMIAASHRNVVLTGAAKLGARARHRVCACDRLDTVITDATKEETADLTAAGMEIIHA